MSERHRESAVSGLIPLTDLEQRLRHCEQSAAVHAGGSPGLLHCVRNDGAVHGKERSDVAILGCMDCRALLAMTDQ